MSAGRTPTGFKAGALEVMYAASWRGYAVVFVQTERECVEITASPKGRSLCVHRTLRKVER